jgi:DNA-directed RNA polymerase specialized sigma24 family protein
MLRTVAFNLMVQDLRYRKRRAGPRPTEFDPADQGPGPVDEVCLREKEGLLEEALAQLPADQATILRATLQGQDAETIARNLGFTKPQVFQRLFKARRRVEKLLGLAPDTADPRSQEPTHGPAH